MTKTEKTTKAKTKAKPTKKAAAQTPRAQKTRTPSRAKATKSAALGKKAPLKSATKTASKTALAKAKPRKRADEKAGIPEQLRARALAILDDRKAENVIVVDRRGRSALADYVIVATGQSSRQVAALADYLTRAFAEVGAKNIRVEGLPESNWVLVDSGDVLVHLFRPEVRAYYNIEEILASGGPGV